MCDGYTKEHLQEDKLYLTSPIIESPANINMNMYKDYSLAIASKSMPKQIIHIELEEDGGKLTLKTYNT